MIIHPQSWGGGRGEGGGGRGIGKCSWAIPFCFFSLSRGAKITLKSWQLS